ncbi:MAG TPA: glycosyltransferase [Erysipelotrichaceae bacterium]|nr:glycosyltransferase [Erysipelotrichaceae bacterium]
MKLSIIIPCYNEAKDIAKNVDIVKEYLSIHNIEHELILVNDGSKDNTKEIIESIPDVTALSYEPNRGKGGAVKYGIEQATGDYVLFMDADLSTDLSAIEKVIELIPSYDFILGSRHAKGSVIKKKQPLLRVFIGWGCRVIVNMMFRLKLKDTQCGFKAIRTEVAKKIVSKQLINDFAFDVEYIYIAKLNKISMYELGITWSDDRDSKVSPFRSSVKFFKDLAFIKRNKKYYPFDSQEQVNTHSGKGVVVLMVSLIIILVAVFIAFLFVQHNEDNTQSSQSDNLINETINNKFIDVVNDQIEADGFAIDNIKTISAAFITDNYPTNFSLNIACHSEDNVYIYKLIDYPYLNDNDDTAIEYLLNNNELDLNQGVILTKYSLDKEVRDDNKIYKYITYNNKFSGYYLNNNVYQIYFNLPYVDDNNLFQNPASFNVDQDNQLYSYYSYLNQ